MKKINGYSVIDSDTSERYNSILILAAREVNRHGDDYEYIVAEIKDWGAVNWPSGRYFRTLDLAFAVFKELRGDCGHKPLDSDGHCGEIICRNYAGKHI